jgi:hypothetical protein
VTYTAIFRDGPLGGQFREVPGADHMFRVMVPPPIRVTDYAHHVGPCLELPEPEVYELVGAAGRMLDYRWVNPAASLRDEVKRLRRQVSELTRRIDDAKDALGC